MTSADVVETEKLSKPTSKTRAHSVGLNSSSNQKAFQPFNATAELGKWSYLTRGDKVSGVELTRLENDPKIGIQFCARVRLMYLFRNMQKL